MQRARPAPAGPTGLAGRILRFPLTRIVLALLFVVGAQSVAALLVLNPVRNALTVANGSALDFLLIVVQILVALLAYVAYVRLVERRPVWELSLRGALGELGTGLLLGAGLFTVAMGIVWLLGGHAFTAVNGLGAVFAPLAAALVAGFVEEVIFRGILFRIVEESLGSWIALALTAALFGALHLFSPEATLQGVVAIALSAGVLLGAAYVLTRRLWLAIGIHAAWNFVQGGVFGVSVSGNESQGLLEGSPTGPELVSGGAFGVEASIVTVVAVGALGVVFLLRAVRNDNVVTPYWRR